jgi:dimethylargininase
MFTKAIVRQPCKNLVHGITSASLGAPDYQKALIQHQQYADVLTRCGLEVTILDADEHFPDSVFVEDTALLTPKCAIITNPGATSRNAETIEMEKVIKHFHNHIEHIKEPGTLDAGDVMMVGTHFYIGLSQRTNHHGASQLINILNKYGHSGSTISLKSVLHLKTGVSYIENNTLLACGEFLSESDFKQYKIIEVPKEESYAANSLWVNDWVLVPKGYPKTHEQIGNAGYKTIVVDVSEFRKLDGGLSCLSLRF